MQIINGKLIHGSLTVDLPKRPVESVVTVWEVPTEYRENGLYIAVVPVNSTPEIPACSHTAPIFVGSLPAEASAINQAIVDYKVSIFKAAIQKHMDDMAVAHRYYSLDSAVSYAALPIGEPYQDEGIAFLVWRARVWKECYVILDKVLTGVLPEPTVEELITMLPQLVLPTG